MLTLRLEFLTGRYCASTPTNRNEAEWPPHPARVYSALVAAHYDGDQAPAGRAALEWLEAQSAPAIHFSPLSPDGLEVRDLFDNYVPVNDKALSDSAQVDRAWRKLSSAKTDKQVAAAEKGLAKAYAKVGGRQAKLSKKADEDLRHVLPETRTRQARTFPTVIPLDATVWFSWDIEAPHQHITALNEISRTLSRVGHSSSLACANWQTEPPVREPTLVPSAEGSQNIRWVGAGQLQALDDLHDRAPFGEQRVMPYVAARYGLAIDNESQGETVFNEQLLVLRRVEGPRLSVSHVEFLAEALRGALMHHADDPVASIISGHFEDETRGDDHLAVFGMANVGQQYANGDVLGLALSLPRAASTADLAAVYKAVAQWEAAGCELRLGKQGVWRLAREIGRSHLRTLHPGAWTRASRRWVSATPLLLDRHPGDLHSGSAEKQRRAHEKAREMIARACERISLPAPAGIEISRAPLLRGALHAKAFRAPPSRRDSRPRVHATLVFDEPVRGPVLLGAGRYRGLGVFRPMGEEDGA